MSKQCAAPWWRPVFGDVVEFMLGDERIQAFVIGLSHQDGKVVVANRDILGLPIRESACSITGAGFHEYCRSMQRQYLALYPGTLKGLFPG